MFFQCLSMNLIIWYKILLPDSLSLGTRLDHAMLHGNTHIPSDIESLEIIDKWVIQTKHSVLWKVYGYVVIVSMWPQYSSTSRTTRSIQCINFSQAVDKWGVATVTAITRTITVPITARTVGTSAAVASLSSSAVRWIGVIDDHNYYLVVRWSCRGDLDNFTTIVITVHAH